MKKAKLLVHVDLKGVSSCAMKLIYDDADGENICVVMSSCAFIDVNGPLKISSESEVKVFLSALQSAEIILK